MSGKLGSANLAATTYTAVYTVPADKISVVSYNYQSQVDIYKTSA